MIATTTGIGFSLLSLGLAFCGIRFFRAFQKMGGPARAGSKIGILLSAMLLSNALTLGILAIGAFFFAGNREVLYIFLLASYFPLTLTGIFGVYAAFYTLHPSVSPWPAVVAVFLLGVVVIVLTVVTHPRPFLDASGGIDWNMSRVLAISLSYLIFIPMGVELAIFIPSFLRAKSREVKAVSLVMIVLALMGIANIFVRFLLPGVTPDSSRTRIFDIMFTIMGLMFISVFLLPPVIIKWISKIQNRDGKPLRGDQR